MPKVGIPMPYEPFIGTLRTKYQVPGIIYVSFCEGIPKYVPYLRVTYLVSQLSFFFFFSPIYFTRENTSCPSLWLASPRSYLSLAERSQQVHLSLPTTQVGLRLLASIVPTKIAQLNPFLAKLTYSHSTAGTRWPELSTNTQSVCEVLLREGSGGPRCQQKHDQMAKSCFAGGMRIGCWLLIGY